MSCFFTLQHIHSLLPSPAPFIYIYIYIYLNAVEGAFSLCLEAKGLLGSTSSDAQLTFGFCDEALCYLVCCYCFGYYCCQVYYYRKDHASTPNIVQRLAEMFARFPQIIHNFSSNIILYYQYRIHMWFIKSIIMIMRLHFLTVLLLKMLPSFIFFVAVFHQSYCAQSALICNHPLTHVGWMDDLYCIYVP